MTIKFDLRDCWIGIYWSIKQFGAFESGKLLEVYVCIVPFFPIRFSRVLVNPITSVGLPPL